jgi:hypothetical protein
VGQTNGQKWVKLNSTKQQVLKNWDATNIFTPESNVLLDSYEGGVLHIKFCQLKYLFIENFLNTYIEYEFYVFQVLNIVLWLVSIWVQTVCWDLLFQEESGTDEWTEMGKT